MDKKTILAIVLCIFVWIVWFQIIEKPKKMPAGADGGVTSLMASPDGGQAEKSAASGKAKEDTEPVKERTREKTATITTSLYEAVFSTRGGSIKSLKLKTFIERNENKPKSALGLEELVTAVSEKGQLFGLRFRSESTTFKFPSATDWELLDEEQDMVRFRYSDPNSADAPVITKTFTALPGTYLLSLEVEVSNRGNSSIKEQIILDVPAGYQVIPPSGCGGCAGAPITPRLPACFANEELISIDPTPGTARSAEPYVLWTGISEQYFILAAVTIGVEKAVCQMEARQDQLLVASLMYPEVDIQPGGSLKHQYRLYAGPKQIELLEQVKGGVSGEQKSQLNKAVDYGWLGVLCHPMIWLLKFFFSWVGNYGIAIIFLTIVVKLLLLPLTQKSMKSSREMAKLRPLLDELKKKYADDKQRFNQEQMNLFKAHKINPLGGCLPMLLQMPIWFALYRTLSLSVELYQTHFFPGWIDDLSAKDPYYILPIVLGIGMFLQQKLTPTTVDSQQAKMMLYMMPIMMTFLMLWLPSGLALYIFVSSILSIGHQVLYNRKYPLPPVPAAAGKQKK